MNAVRKFSVDVGDGEARYFLIRHDLGERDVFVSVYDTETGAALELRGLETCGVGMNVTYTTVNEIEVYWPCWTPGPGQARVVVRG